MLNDKIRIAIIDDDEDDYFIIAENIKAIEAGRFITDWCNDYKDALDHIRSKAYDLYFVDYRLGNQTGLDLLKEASSLDNDAPMILLTGKGNKAIDVQAMESGAIDYLIKSELNTEKIERCIRYSLDRAAAMKELKSRENKYRTLFEGSKDAVFITNTSLCFKEVNHAASLLFEYEMEYLASCNLYDFIKDDGLKEFIKNQLKKNCNITDLEIKIQCPGQENVIKSCLLSLTFQKNADGINMVHGIIHDITSIKKAEVANVLAHKLAANERLVRMLAHEIRNPLNNISLSIENLLLGENAENPHLLDIIKRNSVRINQIIIELLNLTKPPELTFNNHSLQEIVEESISMSMDRINLQKINLVKSYPNTPLTILADKSKLIIAFTNILINAIEAMEIMKGELSVILSSSEDAYLVSIRDNGYGIPDEYLSQLFEPLFTLKKNGMGLGLATSYSIIQSHKGVINVESEVNKGTNFLISFKKNGQI
jgi:PAS domain S-box-containing protein